MDYKTQLQELVQQKKDQVIQYELTGQSGPDHAKQFQVEVRLNGSVVGQGTGSSKNGRSRRRRGLPWKSCFQRNCKEKCV